MSQSCARCPVSPGVCQSFQCSSCSTESRRPVSRWTPRAPHTRSRPPAPGSPGPRAPPIAVSGGGEAQAACGAQVLHLRGGEGEVDRRRDERVGGALHQEGGGDGRAGSRARDPRRGDCEQVHRPRAHRCRWTDIYFLSRHTH